jgi:hypothetical protein
MVRLAPSDPHPLRTRLRLALVTGALAGPGALAGQDEAELAPVLAEVPLRRFIDSRCFASAFVHDRDPAAGQASDLVGALAGLPASTAPRKPYVWIAWLSLSAAGSPNDTLATRLYDVKDARFVEGDKLYEADELRLLVILPAGGPGEPAAASHAVRAGTAVRKERSLLAAGFPSFLAELAAGLISRAPVPGCAPPFAEYDVALHTTPLGTPDATVAARLEMDVSPPLDAERAAEVLAAFRRQRVEIETRWLGYTALGAVFDAIETALAGPACASDTAEACLEAARSAAVETVAGMPLSAEHTITAIRSGTQQALAGVEALLATRHAELSRTFRVVNRPVIGFSVGGILAEESGEKLKFEVEDGRVVAEGIEGEGFKALALVDLYFRRVDIGESSPGIVPHASVGFTIGEVFRPGAFLATTLPFTAGRLSVFAGAILRKETTTDLPAGSEVEPGTEPIEEHYTFPFVAGLKVGLPVP